MNFFLHWELQSISQTHTHFFLPSMIKGCVSLHWHNYNAKVAFVAVVLADGMGPVLKLDYSENRRIERS